MSFGIGISDVLHVLQLARDTVQSCRAAPALFAEASRVSESLVYLLETVEVEYKKPDSPLHHDERTRTDFAIHFRNCQTSAQPLADYIARYTSLGTLQIKITDRFMFSKKTYVELRQNLGFYTARLSEFLQMIGLGALGRIERKVGDVKEFLPQVMDKLDQMCAEMRIMGDKESLLSDHPDDQKHVWKSFRSELIQAGYNSAILQQCQAEIFLRIRELIACGALESDVTHSMRSDDEPLQEGNEIYRMPLRSRTAIESSDSDQEFYKTPTRQRSRNDLRSKKSKESIQSTRSERSNSDPTLSCKPSRDTLRASSSNEPPRPVERRKTESWTQNSTGADEARAKRFLETRTIVEQDGRTSRLWRNPRGHAIEKGTFVAVDGDFVVLRDLAGDEVRIPLSNLSKADISVISKAREQRDVSRKISGSIREDTERAFGPRERQQLTRNFQADRLVRQRGNYNDEDSETIDIPRRTKPEILVGRRTKPVLPWLYRSTVEVKSSKCDTGDRYSDSLPAAAAVGNLEIVKLLLRSGANIEAIGPKSWTETHVTTDSEGNTQTSYTRHSYPETTALYRSSYAGHVKTASYLLAHGADVNTRDGYDGNVGELILYKAIRNGHSDIVRLLLEYEAQQTDRRGTSTLGSRSRSSCCVTALQLSCGYPKPSVVRLLLDYGADIDVDTPGARETPLHIASLNGFAGIVEMLVKEGAKVNTLNREGASPLYKACGRGHADAVRYLLQYGADPSLARGRQGETAMYKAAWANHLDVVDHLLEFEADVNIKNEKQMRGYKDMAEKVMHGVLAGLAKDHALMNTWSKMPLHAAAYQGHRQMVKLLLEAGAEIEAMGNDEITPLYLAAQQGHESTVRCLLRAGAQLETEKHDPVLALINETNKNRNGKGSNGKELTALEEHRKKMVKAGTGDFVVGLIAEVVGGMSKSRRGTL